MPSKYYGRYRFFFYMHDVSNEPIHYHIADAEKEAKIWLDPIRIETNHGFSPNELRKIELVITRNYTELVDFWRQERGKLD